MPAIFKTQTLALGLMAAMGGASSLAAQSSYEFSFGALSDDFLGRSETYGITAFDGAYFSGRHAFGDLRLSYTLGDAFENDAVDAGLVFFDVSYALGDGNWRIGAGQSERHWGPSRYTSLILSRNAPAFPAAYIVKEEATQSDLPVLRWIGPWYGEFLIGTTEDAGQPEDALFVGMRLGLEPTPGLEVEFIRAIQYGGDGQPSGFGAFTDAVFGNTNEGAAAGANQVAGLSLSYDFNPDQNGVRLYGQALGEDEAGGLPSCWFFMAGVEARTRILGAKSTLTLEHVDTTVNTTENGFCGPGTAYGNTTYSYRNEGVVLGAAIGSESRSTQLRGTHEMPNWTLDWSLGHFAINDANLPGHSLSTTRETGTVASIGASFDFAGGTVQGIIAHQDFDLDTADQDSGTRIGVSYSRSF
ncbi:capsule assembly Wzi family protein [Epibacterium ulvae]|uniref:capsule assembly Wzi family protein n=1 Tax=Epibacterium ulvae TaxID=1156985 RepID=UPI00249235FB|nr:capsule assembly Wzi family protein [Epibacterium ulvae]